MRAPNNDPNQAGRARFERSQIADAAFIGATAIIDHEHVAGLRSLHRFQKHIDASIMPCRKRPAGQTRGGNQRRNSRRREAQWNFQAQRRVRHERRGKFREPLPQPFIFHPTILREIALRCQGSFRIVVGAVGRRIDRECAGCEPARMPQRQRYLFVCTNRRPDDDAKGSCANKGSEEVRQALKEQLAARGLAKLQARACTSSCLDQCSSGICILVEPDHFFYGRVTRADVPEIVEAMANGRRVERLVLTLEDLARG